VKVAAAAFAVLALPLTACGGDGEEPVADVGRIACSGTSLAIDTPKIRTQTDGVHLNLRVSDERGVSLFVDGEQVRGEVVMALPPGGVPVKCTHGSGGSMESSFEVVAEDEGPSGY
jgi:hypothetical protein